jgi:hypothetical protein
VEPGELAVPFKCCMEYTIQPSPEVEDVPV